jgi:hypothetical protein
MNPLGIHLSIGVSGSGKTYGMRSAVYDASRHMPIMVIDRMYEWGSVPGRLAGRAVGVTSAADGIAVFKSRPQTRMVIVRDVGEVADSLNAACLWAISSKGPAGVACSEVHRAAPNGGRLPGEIERAVTQWRHHKVGLWLDTQRLALLSRTITEQATELKLYTIVGDRDLSVIGATWGNDLVVAVGKCAAKFAAGEPGWHVNLGIVRTPPYSIARDH